MNLRLYSSILLAVILLACNPTAKQKEMPGTSDYKPEDEALYKTICGLDSTFFAAYNACDLQVQEMLLADDLEFYHDKGGLNTSKADILEATENNICGKVTRILIPGSIEVYPIKNHGAVQIGWHRFENKEEPDAPSLPSKFIVIWKQQGDQWQMSRIVSLHNS